MLTYLLDTQVYTNLRNITLQDSCQTSSLQVKVGTVSNVYFLGLLGRQVYLESCRVENLTVDCCKDIYMTAHNTHFIGCTFRLSHIHGNFMDCTFEECTFLECTLPYLNVVNKTTPYSYQWGNYSVCNFNGRAFYFEKGGQVTPGVLPSAVQMEFLPVTLQERPIQDQWRGPLLYDYPQELIVDVGGSSSLKLQSNTLDSYIRVYLFDKKLTKVVFKGKRFEADPWNEVDLPKQPLTGEEIEVFYKGGRQVYTL